MPITPSPTVRDAGRAFDPELRMDSGEAASRAHVWTPERVALLRRHFAVGLTAVESALLLGGVSRNAVISKRHRLGLVGYAPAGSSPAGGVFVALVPARSRAGMQRPRPSLGPEPLPAMDGAAPPDARPRVLDQLERGDCRWPLGEVERPGDWRTLFCGAPVRGCGPYCPAHARRARPGVRGADLLRARWPL